MPGPIPGLSPVNRDLFFPTRETQTDALRLRRFIEGRQMLLRSYGVAYGGVADTLQQVRDGKHPGVSRMTAEQCEEVERQLLSVRDEIARGFTQAIARAENDANELCSGIFPRADEPFQSFDLGEWFDKILDALIAICHGLGEIFDAFGFVPGAEAMEAAEQALRDFERWGEEQGHWKPDPPDDE